VTDSKGISSQRRAAPSLRRDAPCFQGVRPFHPGRVTTLIWIPLAAASGAGGIGPWPAEMSGFVGVVVSDPSLQGQFTQVELRSLKAKVSDVRIRGLLLRPPPPPLHRKQQLLCVWFAW
jgi:hypothetical protein